MEAEVSLAVAAALLALALFAGWRGSRRPDPFRGPRMIPWRFIMLLAAAGVLMALGHAARLRAGS